MAESNTPVRRVELSRKLSGVQRLKLMLGARGYPSVAAWARAAADRHDPRITEKAAWHALANRRRGSASVEAVIAALARDTGKPRGVIEALIADDA